MLRPELKAFDQYQNNQPVPIWTTMAYSDPTAAFSGITCINLITGGTAVQNMQGMRCNITSVHVKGYFYITNPVAAPYGMMRIMLVYDRQTSQGTPQIANILSNTNTDSLVTAWSQTDIPNEQRFTVIRDHVITLEPNHTLEAFDLYAKGMFPLIRNDAGQIITSYTSGTILLIAYGNAPANTFSLSWSSRVRFSDV